MASFNVGEIEVLSQILDNGFPISKPPDDF